tara:strand:+ start:224 stop:580 length:357 start_codon:yes stop_codon:yes gene_type:complete
MKDDIVLKLFDQWNTALKTQDPHQVLTCYASKSILLPTLSNQVCDTFEKKLAYFQSFCQKGPVGTIDVSYSRQYGDIVIHSGIYTFAFNDQSEATARFTYVYQDSLIIEHHSSLLPEN